MTIPVRDFWVHVHGPRAADFQKVFGTSSVCVRSPAPHLAFLPGYDEPQEVYLLDLDLGHGLDAELGADSIEIAAITFSEGLAMAFRLYAEKQSRPSFEEVLGLVARGRLQRDGSPRGFHCGSPVEFLTSDGVACTITFDPEGLRAQLEVEWHGLPPRPHEPPWRCRVRGHVWRVQFGNWLAPLPVWGIGDDTRWLWKIVCERCGERAFHALAAGR